MGANKTMLRILLGLAGQEAQIWDVDATKIMKNGSGHAANCPTIPSFVIDARSFTNAVDPANVLTAFEAVEISSDGLTVALGAEAKNAVALVLPPGI